MSIVFTIPLKH